MQNKNQIVRFDYSKYESKPRWDDPCLREMSFWGIFQKNNRFQIDIKRYISICESMGMKGETHCWYFTRNIKKKNCLFHIRFIETIM